MRDKFQTLVHDGDFAVTILGNTARADFELVDLTAPVPENIQARLAPRGLYFLGNIGVVDAVPRIALDVPVDEAMADRLAEAYLKHVERLSAGALEVAWIERLFKLEGPPK